MKSSIEISGLDKLKRDLTDLQRERFPSAMRNAINYVLDDVKNAEVARMNFDFKNPTKFTLNAMKKEEATKTKLSGRVAFKDPTRLSASQHYLYPNTYGVVRGFKPFEAALNKKGILKKGWFAMPGNGVQLDSYGNVPASLYVQILAFFSAFAEQGTKQNMTDQTRAKRKKGTRKKYGFEYFVIKEQKGRLMPGIYRRTFTAFGTATDAMFIFVPKSRVWYTKLYKFHETGEQIFKSNFQKIFDKELDRIVNELR